MHASSLSRVRLVTAVAVAGAAIAVLAACSGGGTPTTKSSTLPTGIPTTTVPAVLPFTVPAYKKELVNVQLGKTETQTVTLPAAKNGFIAVYACQNTKDPTATLPVTITVTPAGKSSGGSGPRLDVLCNNIPASTHYGMVELTGGSKAGASLTATIDSSTDAQNGYFILVAASAAGGDN